MFIVPRSLFKRFSFLQKTEALVWSCCVYDCQCVSGVCVSGVCTGAADVISLSFILAAATRLVSQILKIHLHLFTVLLHGALS